ncbi:MAG: DUF4177 domain-containing protein [Clostridiales bacterium]|nr:DUF4177 domain-containing protein [Clostridiales bacterium]
MRKSFEHKTVPIKTEGFFGGKIDSSDFNERLDSYGKDGWELISATASNESQGRTVFIICIFKREILQQ